MAEIIRIEHLHKTYEQGMEKIHVLENVNLSISSGEFVALLGPSGSGKSTLLNIIGLLDSPSSGSIEVFGKDVIRMNENEKAVFRLNNIGFVFQFDSMLPEFTLTENVDMPAILAGKPDRFRAVELLSRFGLSPAADRMPSEVSGGERQRAALARALR